MKAVITVTGKDSQGIIAKVSTKCFEMGGNIIDISQSVMKDYFAMIMLVEIEKINCEFSEFADSMKQLGENSGLFIQAVHEDIFNSMHRI